MRRIFIIALYMTLGLPCFADNADWMQAYASIIGPKPLKDVFLPGTHDSATYDLEHTFGKNQDITHQLNNLKYIGVGFIVTKIAKNWSIAQDRSIKEQLEDGNRYFDLRVIYRDSKKEFYTVHGLYGPSLKEVLKQITKFMKKHPKEILIIQVGDLRYMPHGTASHQDLIKQLRTAFGENLVLKSTGTNVTVNELWQQNKQVILIYKDTGIARNYADIWDRSAIEDYWANEVTPDKLKPKLDQRLNQRNAYLKNKFYIVQAQLTPSDQTIKDGLNVFLGTPKSLKDLANLVKPKLPHWLESWKDKNPNIIMLDFADKHTAQQIIELNNHK